MGKVILILFLSLLGTVLCDEKKQENDNVADSSVTSYSTVVIHHPPGKKSNLVKDGEEGRSQAYFKVKRLKASTIPPTTSEVQNGHNGAEFRVKNNDFKVQNDDLKAQNSAQQSDFRPSQYLPEPELRVSFRGTKDQTGQAARNTEYRQSKQQREPELRKHKYREESHEEREPVSWTQHYRQGGKYHEEKREYPKQNHEVQHHREIYHEHFPPRNEDSRLNSAPHQQNFHTSFTYDTPNSVPTFPELRQPYEHFSDHSEITHHPTPLPPPGMSEELIQTLLSQQPQTFDTEKKPEPKKKSKSQTFKVGYSIGFGGSDIVMGKPKDLQLHVNGRNSVWKKLPNGVEMSEEVDNKKPLALRLQDSSEKSNENLLKNDVYYINNYKPDTSVPTSGRGSFDHAQALTHSNSFDFSNAVDPNWLKHPKALDMGNIYQNLGYPAPLPVLLPGAGPHGQGTMVQAIVIPIESLTGFDYASNWAGLPQVPLMPIGPQPVAQALTLNPGITGAPLFSQNQAPQHHSSSLSPTQGHEKPRFKVRTPKAKDSLKQGSYNSAPIVVAPASPNRQAELQKELNNILAEEMLRKNHRMPAVGLRPPPPF